MLSSKPGFTEVKDAPNIEAQPPASAPDSSDQAQSLDISTSSELTPSQPHDQTTSQSANDGSAFSWPQAGRGHAVLSDEDYKAAINFLLAQDFFDEEVSFASTKAFNDKVAALADELWIGQQVVGKKIEEESAVPAQTVNTLANTVLVRKRKKDESEASDKVQAASSELTQASGVNVLQGNLIRKKKKP
jgi:regulator of Ty1 transposition protein 109